MEELILQLTTIARSMWRFRWPALIVAWIIALVGVAVALRVPERFEATARIYVDTQSILKPLMSGLAVQPNVEQQVAMLSRTLISRPNLEKLVRMADLDLKSDTRAKQDATIDSLMGALEIKSTARDNLYSLSYRNEDPAKAQRVIQSLVSIFVESSLGATRKDTDSAKVFIAEQIKSYEAKLEDAETRLKAFRLRNIDLQTGEGRDSASRLGELNAQLDQAKLELREAETARDATKQQMAAEKSQSTSTAVISLLQEAPGSAGAPATPEIDARIEAQKRNLDGLLQRFTEQHPEVISVRRLLKDLEDQKRKEVLELRRAAAATPAARAAAQGNTLAYQDLSRMLASAEVQVAALQARVSEYTARANQARASLKTAPQLEAEAAQLNRDYNIHRKNYEDLVSRRESAAMSGDLDVAAGVADFRLIDPPRVSPKPVSPNRFVQLPMALVVALFGGLLTAFIGSQLRPVFHQTSDLRNKVDLPVLGLVSRVLSDADKRRARIDLLRFVGGTGGLVGVFVAGLAVLAVLGK